MLNITYFASYLLVNNIGFTDKQTNKSDNISQPSQITVGAENHQGDFNPGIEVVYVIPQDAIKFGYEIQPFVRLSPVKQASFVVSAKYTDRRDTTSYEGDRTTIGAGVAADIKIAPNVTGTVGYSFTRNYDHVDGFPTDRSHGNGSQLSLRVHL